MHIKNHVSSRAYNTFSSDVNIDTILQIDAKEDFEILERYGHADIRVLGGGSNVLFTTDVTKPLVLINTKGIDIIKDAEEYVLVSIAAGEVWHDVVMWAIKHNYGGIENLSLIPGKCGAAPIQNIGAYGVELKDVIHTVKAWDITKGIECFFHSQECAFGYRSSNFKSKWKGQYIIKDIILRLTKPGHHKLKMSYGAITSELKKRSISQPTIKDISDVVISIRQSKLPDPKVIGNAGSFFKNPIIDKATFETLKSQYPDMPNYPAGDAVKLAAGWLIDQCGWKGKRVGDTGTHENQALVIVNRGHAKGTEVLAVSKAIQKDVLQKFAIELEPEVNIW